MIDEHAIELSKPITIDQLSYLIKKANRMGLSHREIGRVFQEKEGEKVHIYFEAEVWKTLPQPQGQKNEIFSFLRRKHA